MSNVLKTEVRLLRKDSKGIIGTYENANHHAQLLLPFINELKRTIMKLGFKEWIQGHNVHEFITTDGRKFTLRGIVAKNEDDVDEYVGIRLSSRVSRSLEIRLFDANCETSIKILKNMMEYLATPPKGYQGRLLSTNVI